jgi:ribose-phosphate pyrophosphokinase
MELKVFSGTANSPLASTTCNELGVVLGKVNIKKFADHELFVEFAENIRGCDVFLMQPTSYPVNDNLMELMLMIDAAKRASAGRITASIPYFGYARQDRKDRPRVPISAKVVATMLEGVGVDRILTMDLHNPAIGGFFEVPVDHLYALPVFIDWITAKFVMSRLTVVTPDAGGTQRARLLAKKLGAPLALIDKHREAANVSEVMNVIGNVDGRDCLLVDDLIDTAGTLVKGAKALKALGARSVSAVASHGVLSYDQKEDISAIDKIEQSCLQEVIVVDTIDQRPNQERILRGAGPADLDGIRVSSKLKVLSVASLFAKAITAIHSNESVSGLFV